MLINFGFFAYERSQKGETSLSHIVASTHCWVRREHEFKMFDSFCNLHSIRWVHEVGVLDPKLLLKTFRNISCVRAARIVPVFCHGRRSSECCCFAGAVVPFSRVAANSSSFLFGKLLNPVERKQGEVVGVFWDWHAWSTWQELFYHQLSTASKWQLAGGLLLFVLLGLGGHGVNDKVFLKLLAVVI